MTLIAEDTLVLLLDDESGRSLLDATRLSRVLAGGLLVELAVDGRVSPAAEGDGAKPGRLVVRDPQPTGDPLLDRALALLTESKPMKPERAVERLQKGIRDELLARLINQGLIREERRRALGILPRTVWPAGDLSHESLLRAELSQVLVHGIEPTPRTAALVSLLAAVDAAPKVIPSDDRRGVKRRAKEIADGEWAGAAVRKAVQAVTAGVAAAATAAAVASSGG
jgi:hypothetical protein